MLSRGDFALVPSAWHRTPYSTCGLASCASCEHFLSGRCPACVRGNALVRRANQPQCAIYRCVKSKGIESCRACRAASCPVLEQGKPVRCDLADYFAGERGGMSLVKALTELRSIREEHSPLDLPPRLKQRLPLYLAALQALKREGVEHVASAELALRIGCSAALVRKDLSSIGQWGRRSAGYSVELLSDNLRSAAGLGLPRRAAWLGCERLAAEPRLVEDFAYMGCIIAAVFCDEGKEPGALAEEGLIVRPLSELPQVARELDLKLAVIAVDDDRAQAAAELAAASGLRSILNLTDRVLVQPRGTMVENVSPLRGLVSLMLRAPASFAGKPRRKRPS